MSNEENTNYLAGLNPVDLSVQTANDREGPQAGIALCLSGGGYRAMLFHAGAIWRLCEIGAIPALKRISSVSGGSIIAALLGLKWNQLKQSNFNCRNYETHVVTPIRALAGKTIDVGSIITGLLGPDTVSERVRMAYEQHLYGQATLQHLPSDEDGPRFVINATNVQTGSLWRFMKPYMADYQVGQFANPDVSLALAVAASSAFPPFLSPVDLNPDPSAVIEGSEGPFCREPLTTDVLLTDGGVYDNLGLETAWKRYQTILVSDGGGKVGEEEEPKRDWARHAVRVFEVTDNQVRSLRKQQIIGSIAQRLRTGAYWSIRDDISTHQVGFPINCPASATAVLAKTETRLKRLDPERQEKLINWGYAVCAASVGRWLDSDVAFGHGLDLNAGIQFPYGRGV